MIKHQFQTDLGRKCRENKKFPTLKRWVVNDFPNNVQNELTEKGWVTTGDNDDGPNHRSIGMQKGEEFITLGDCGKPPYYCGQTQITLSKTIGQKRYSGPPIVEPMR